MAMQAIPELDKRFYSLLNNVSHHKLFTGTLKAFLMDHYQGAKATTVYTLQLDAYSERPPRLERCGFLLDDGYSVKPFYVAGWSADKTEIFIHPIHGGMGSYMGPREMRILTLEGK